MSSKIFYIPERLTSQYFKDFLDVAKDIFKRDCWHIPDVVVRVDRINKVDILGQLLLYKFFDYTVQNQCFIKPVVNLIENKYLNAEMTKLGFKNLMKNYIKANNLKDDDFKYNECDSFFIAPIVLRSDKSKAIDANNIKKIENFYGGNKDIQNIVLQSIGEIGSNFQEHADCDTQSVIVAKGEKSYIEVACADNGVGIINSLRAFGNKDTEVMRRCIDKGVSSKIDKWHTGSGLWIINQLVNKSNGTMIICSQNCYLKNKKGHITVGESPLWKGTFIYVKIPLLATLKLSDIFVGEISPTVQLNII
ncbi:MAG: hypothetical protein MJ237_09015 [bacterium]|nr:hypothetical protein [bacterium]